VQSTPAAAASGPNTRLEKFRCRWCFRPSFGPPTPAGQSGVSGPAAAGFHAVSRAAVSGDRGIDRADRVVQGVVGGGEFVEQHAVRVQPAVQGLEPSPEIKLVPPKRTGRPGRPPVLDAEQARDVLRRRAEGETYMAIAIHYGVSMTAITNICYGVTYRELPGRAA
jgi:hypothetical protein